MTTIVRSILEKKYVDAQHLIESQIIDRADYVLGEYKKIIGAKLSEGRIDELSSKTLGNYIGKSSVDAKGWSKWADYHYKKAASRTHDEHSPEEHYKKHNNATRKEVNRHTGILRATKKLVKRATANESISDKDTEARELKLYADNDGHLYRSSQTPIIKNLQKKHDKGIYDHEKAKKLWKYHADRAAMKYHKEHIGTGSWHHSFPTHVRNKVASALADEHKDEHGWGK